MGNELRPTGQITRDSGTPITVSFDAVKDIPLVGTGFLKRIGTYEIVTDGAAGSRRIPAGPAVPFNKIFDVKVELEGVRLAGGAAGQTAVMKWDRANNEFFLCQADGAAGGLANLVEVADGTALQTALNAMANAADSPRRPTLSVTAIGY